MAGQAVVSSFMQVLFEKLINVATDELSSLQDVQEQLHSLTTTLSAIQALLEDAEEKQFNDMSIRSWLAKLKDVAYDMDDLLEDYTTEAILKRKVEERSEQNSSYWRMKLRRNFTLLYCWHNVQTNYKFARRVKKIEDSFSRIVKERDNLGLQILGGTSQIPITYRPQTSSLLDESKVFGREEETQDIVQMLLSLDGNSGRVSILPIVGMGGLGKTTLAQSVYNDKRIKDHFHPRMWVCVSDNFDELKLTNETLNCAAQESSSFVAGNTSFVMQSHTMTNMNLLQQNLCQKLKGKRFLLALDDVWNEDPYRWECFRTALFSGENGSAIVVTTQNANVGRIMGGLRPYNLKQLSDSNCWTLFRNYAFVGGDCTAHPNLEKIGMQIVKKLKGLPLAAKAIGSLLYSKTDEEVWRGILKSEIWELPLGKHNILPALKLSYKHLPSHLKQCFAFCSVYHKDFVFQKDKLVKIWIALGFIQRQGRKRLEDIGSSYFHELVSRSFFQPYKGSYVMHDAIHDLAQSLSVQESHRLEDDTIEFSGNHGKVRHISLSSTKSKIDTFQEFYKFNKLRTLLLLRGYKAKINQIPNDLFSRLKCLRVLDLHRRRINELPDSLGNLIQLRYLSIAGTEITRLPPSVSRLYNLQTMNLTHCNLLTELPHGVTKLLNLRHLEATSNLISEIAGLGSLTSLQELEEFIVRKQKGYTIAELECMTELQGQMHIKNIQNVADSKEASKAKLNAKEYLKVLCLEWDHENISSLEQECEDEGILDALQPHYELKELKINGYAGSKFPNWVGIPSFCYLESIYLSNCSRCQVLPALGQLPLLKYLGIGGFETLTKISSEFYGCSDTKGFPKLVEFIIQDILQLQCWILNDDSDFFPNLRELEIADCPKLSKLPSLLPTLTRLRIAEAGINSLPEMRNSGETISLSTVDVHYCPNLESLQVGLLDQQRQLRNLEQLRITDCEELITLPSDGFCNLVSLKSLHIRNCPKLTAWEDGRRLLPGSLEDLQIFARSNLINNLLAEVKYLTSLQHITIADCPDLHHFQDEALPESLKVLEISNCENIQNLPAGLRLLSSLTNLVLNNCKQITSLPFLPSKLQMLRITQCPLLEEYCQWHKLDHILIVEIDGSIHHNQLLKEHDQVNGKTVGNQLLKEEDDCYSQAASPSTSISSRD